MTANQVKELEAQKINLQLENVYAEIQRHIKDVFNNTSYIYFSLELSIKAKEQLKKDGFKVEDVGWMSSKSTKISW